MKKFNLLFILFGLFTVSFLSSCDTTTDGEDVAPLLTITTTGLSSSNTIVEGTTFNVVVTAAQNPTSGKKLETLEIQTPGADTTIAIDAASYSEDFDLDAPLDGVSHTYTLILTDKSGESVTKTLTVTGISGSIPFGAEVTGAFFHIAGTEHGAYDLVAEATVASSGAEGSKDMKNTDQAGNAFTGSWTTGTGNATEFVRDNSFDYDNASVDDAIAAFAAGSPTTTVLNPLAGNVLIAKLRGGTDYAIIEITSVDPTFNPSGSAMTNLGKITFNFKKQ